MYFQKTLVNNYNLFYIGGLQKWIHIWIKFEETLRNFLDPILSRSYELLVIGLLLVIELLVKLFFKTWDNFPNKTLPILGLKEKKKLL